MLFWALNPENSYGYYTLLRFVCCPIFAFLAYRYQEMTRSEWVWIFGVLAVIYNPFVRVHLSRDIWSIVNVATIVVNIVSIFIQNQKEKES